MSEPSRAGAHGGAQQPVFLSVAKTAQLVGMSVMTLYRAIHGGEFPAVRVRGRLLVPVRAIDEMVSAAMTSGAVVDAAEWARPAAAVVPEAVGPVGGAPGGGRSCKVKEPMTGAVERDLNPSPRTRVTT